MHIDWAGQACFAGFAATAFLALAVLLFGGRRVFAMRPSTPAADSRIFLLSSGHYSVKTWPADPRLAPWTLRKHHIDKPNEISSRPCHSFQEFFGYSSIQRMHAHESQYQETD